MNDINYIDDDLPNTGETVI